MPWVEIWDNRQLLLLGLLFTVILTLVTVVTSTLLGFLVALVRNARVPILSQIMRVYLEVFRGSPLLVQILFVYFGSAYLNLRGVSVFLAVTIAMTLYQGAYISEIFRAGIESVPLGQREAARTLGLSDFQTMKSVVLPQAMRVSLPPLFGQYIALVKNTSLASVIGYADLVRQGQGIIDRFGNPFEVFLVIGVLYFIISYPFSLVARRLERKAARA
jgi:polar amino acid transport system permease protein